MGKKQFFTQIFKEHVFMVVIAISAHCETTILFLRLPYHQENPVKLTHAYSEMLLGSNFDFMLTL